MKIKTTMLSGVAGALALAAFLSAPAYGAGHLIVPEVPTLTSPLDPAYLDTSAGDITLNNQIQGNVEITNILPDLEGPEPTDLATVWIHREVLETETLDPITTEDQPYQQTLTPLESGPYSGFNLLTSPISYGGENNSQVDGDSGVIMDTDGNVWLNATSTDSQAYKYDNTLYSYTFGTGDNVDNNPANPSLNGAPVYIDVDNGNAILYVETRAERGGSIDDLPANAILLTDEAYGVWVPNANTVGGYDFVAYTGTPFEVGGEMTAGFQAFLAGYADVETRFDGDATGTTYYDAVEGEETGGNLFVEGNAQVQGDTRLDGNLKLGAIDDVEEAIDGNTSDIAVNASDIDVNASDIDVNAAAIVVNASDIDVNASDIDVNAAAIVVNASDIDVNASDIDVNAAAIVVNASDIDVNAAAIDVNASDIDVNAAGIAMNASDIDVNAAGIAMNASDIDVNAAGIAMNASDIDVNAAGIAMNASDIAAIDADVTANGLGIAANTAAIVSNDSDIAANTAAIVSNDADIAANTADIGENANDIGDLQSLIYVDPHGNTHISGPNSDSLYTRYDDEDGNQKLGAIHDMEGADHPNLVDIDVVTNLNVSGMSTSDGPGIFTVQKNDTPPTTDSDEILDPVAPFFDEDGVVGGTVAVYTEKTDATVTTESTDNSGFKATTDGNVWLYKSGAQTENIEYITYVRQDIYDEDQGALAGTKYGDAEVGGYFDVDGNFVELGVLSDDDGLVDGIGTLDPSVFTAEVLADMALAGAYTVEPGEGEGGNLVVEGNSTLMGNLMLGDIDDVEMAIGDNVADIATNAAGIATNASTLVVHEGLVTKNIADIATNATAITTEAAARAAADSAEATARAAADVTLQGNIDAEATTRAAADVTLQGNIDAEATARAAADTAEATARAAADTTLQGNIDAEETARMDADSALQSDIDDNADTLDVHFGLVSGNISDIAANRSSINSLQSAMNSARMDIDTNTRGIAMVAALTHTTILPGMENALDISMAYFEGETGISISYSRRINEGTQINFAAASTSDFEESVVRAGIGWQW